MDVITLQDYIQELQLNHIDVLKIDTEGHEIKCLEGLFSPGYSNAIVDFIQLEHHLDDMYLSAVSNEDMAMLLQHNGFQMSRKVKHGFGNFNELLFKNMLH